MNNTDQWTKKDLLDLHEFKKNKSNTWNDIARKMGKTRESVRKKFYRTNWKNFFKDPEQYVERINIQQGSKWTEEEMIRLDVYLQDDKSYGFIAKKIVEVQRL